ncbi:MAG: M3 family metallopeptidase [Bacteroidales bacterium]|nr:M3 family metallopeptidase [Bacteroidales bacterium]
MINFTAPFQAVCFDKIKNDQYMPAFRSILDDSQRNIEKIVSDPEMPTFENTIEALETSLHELKRMELVFFNINAAETNKEIQQIAQEVSPLLTEFYNNITLNEALFRKVKILYGQKDQLSLPAESYKLLEETHKNFIRNGAALDPESKTIFRETTRELSVLTLKFEENLLDETNAYQLHLTEEKDLSGLPGFVREAAALEAKSRNLQGWVFTLKAPSYTVFMKYADNRELREKMYRANSSRCYHKDEKDNQEIIKRIAELRLKLANLLGYDTYARYVLENRMAETPERVNSFLQDILEASMPVAREEYAGVQELARKQGAAFALQRWDWSYYSEKLKIARFDISDEIIKPYLKLENVEKGIFDLIGRLYGLSFKTVDNIPVYHQDVRTFEVRDVDGRFLALLYLDYFPREGKQGGAWMTNYLEQHKKAIKDIRPHVSLVFNFTKPTGSQPSLLTYDELRTFLHEFGHALHSILSECRYWSLSGTNVYRDFVELPSQILENWGEEKEWLSQVAVHYETGEKMPGEMIDKIIQSRNFNNGYAFVRQLSFGLNDMSWHSVTQPFTGDVADFERNAMAPAELFPQVDECCFSTGFHHIFGGGYAAGYYGYKWAEVLDADAFSLFRQNGIFDRKTAQSFRKNILSRGGTEHPMVLYKRFRGQEPSIEPLLERSGLRK